MADALKKVAERLKAELAFEESEAKAITTVLSEEQAEGILAMEALSMDGLKSYLKSIKKSTKVVKDTAVKFGGKKPVKEEEEPMTEKTVAEGTANEATLKAGSKHVDSKASLVSSIVSQMMLMNKGDLTKWFDQAQATIGHEADKVPDGAHGKNKASIAAKGSAKGIAKEDVEALFDGEELSEDFKAKTVTIFEAAVEAAANLRFIEIEEALEAEYATKLEESVAKVESDLTEKLDAYMGYMAEKWMEDNQVAIESALRNELVEEFIDGLKNLFVEHYIDVPEEKIDVMEEMAAKMATLEEKLDEVISENHTLRDELDGVAKDKTFAEVAEGLANTQADKLRVLSEGIDDEGSIEVFKAKLTQIKESYFKVPKAAASPSNILTERVEIEEPTANSTAPVDPSMARYAAAITRSVK